MPDQNSFDIVSQIDLQEVKNAVDQAMKEIHQRFDFKDSKSEITLEDQNLIVLADDEFKLKNVLDILQSKLVKRGVSLKAITYGTPEHALGGLTRQKLTMQQGIPQEKAKEIVKAIRDAKFKVQPQIQADQIRVSSKSKDELQTAIAFLRQKDFAIPLQFTNYR